MDVQVFVSNVFNVVSVLWPQREQGPGAELGMGQDSPSQWWVLLPSCVP